MNIFEIKTLIPAKDGNRQMLTSYIVASHIKEVITELAIDFDDEATEVISISNLAPVYKILQ